MDITGRVFAPFGIIKDPQTRETVIDIDSFVRRLILFDEYIVNTIRLTDIPQLAKNFGSEGLIELLKTGIIKIHCDALTMGQTGQTTAMPSREKAGALPLGSYSFQNINIADRKWYISDCLKNVHDFIGPTKKAIAVKKAIVESLIEEPPLGVFNGFEEALIYKKNLVKASLLEILPGFGFKADPLDLSIEISKISDHDYRTDTNLSKLLKISPEKSHKIIERALLNVSGFYQRLGYMREYEAISWFHQDDIVLLENELSIYTSDINAKEQEDRLLRILKLKGLPTIAYDAEIDVEDLIKIRDSKECLEFKQWLRTIDVETDADIQSTVNSMSEKISSILRTRTSKVVQFIITTGAGTLVANPLVGIGVGAVEEFIIDSMVKKPGPISFINNSLPKLYTNS